MRGNIYAAKSKPETRANSAQVPEPVEPGECEFCGALRS